MSQAEAIQPKCASVTCEKEAAPGWKYCSRDCAPGGAYSNREPVQPAPPKRESGECIEYRELVTAPQKREPALLSAIRAARFTSAKDGTKKRFSHEQAIEIFNQLRPVVEGRAPAVVEGEINYEPRAETSVSYEIQTLAEAERDAIVRALEATGGNRTRAAVLLETSIRTLRNKINEYGLKHLENESDDDLGDADLEAVDGLFSVDWMGV